MPVFGGQRRTKTRRKAACGRTERSRTMEKTDLKTQLAEVAERIRTMREITGLSEGEMAKCTGVPLE